jgi:hypothetical protein
VAKAQLVIPDNLESPAKLVRLVLPDLSVVPVLSVAQVPLAVKVLQVPLVTRV